MSKFKGSIKQRPVKGKAAFKSVPEENGDSDSFDAKNEKIMLDNSEKDFSSGEESYFEQEEEAVLDYSESEDDTDDEEEEESEGESGSEGFDVDDAKDYSSEEERSDFNKDLDAKAWGKKKATYYEADDSDEDDRRIEEEEALRLAKEKAKLLRTSDFCDDVSFAAQLENGEAKAKITTDSESSSEDENDVFNDDNENSMNTLTDEQKIEIINNHSPELLTLLSEFKSSLATLQLSLAPKIEAVKSLPTSNGLSFLQVKYQLLLNYCTNLCFYLYLKAKGAKIENHPVIDQLVKLRIYIEKIKPLETKFKYQIDKLLNMSSLDTTNSNDSSLLKPNPANIVEDDDGDENGYEDSRGDATYKAPKITPMFFDENASLDKKSRKEAAEEKLLHKIASKTRLLRDLQEEFSERPEEISDKLAIERDDEYKSRVAYEEENMLRFTLSKKEKTKIKKKLRPENELDNFDDFSDLVKSKSLEKLYSLDKNAETSLRSESGSKKRRKDADDFDNDMESDIEDDMTTNDFYDTVKAKRQAKINAKSETFKHAKTSRKVHFNPVQDMDNKDSKRPANRDILKNKGLTPKRPKENQNPRVKQRNRFERASKKLKTFKPVYKADSGPYRGQSTGIKTNISRSVKFD